MSLWSRVKRWQEDLNGLPADSNPRYEEFCARLDDLKRGEFQAHTPSKLRQLCRDQAEFHIRKAQSNLDQNNAMFIVSVGMAERFCHLLFILEELRGDTFSPTTLDDAQDVPGVRSFTDGEEVDGE